MRPLVFPPVAPWVSATIDGLAIAGFTIAGILSHRHALPAGAVAEDAVPLLAGWFLAAAAFRLYRRRTWRALLSTWAVGVSLGVLLRAAVLGRLDEPRQLAFLTTTLVLSLTLVLAARAATSLAVSQRRG